jgi:hypothetical protein
MAQSVRSTNMIECVAKFGKSGAQHSIHLNIDMKEAEAARAPTCIGDLVRHLANNQSDVSGKRGHWNNGEC